MTTTLAISLLTIDPIVLSKSAATVGGHETIDHVPGSALLGVVASSLYPVAESESGNLLGRRETLFHSGKIRFSNAYPVVETGEIGLPMPLSLFRRKSEGSTHGAPTTYYDRSVEGDAGGAQLVQQRAGFITGSGRDFRAVVRNTLRTSIEASSGTAKTGALYDYTAIAAGTRFAAFVEVDDHGDELAREIADLFQGTIRLGRARSSEYGRVKSDCRILDRDPRPPLVTTNKSEGNAVRVYCLSDVALLDEFGQPAREISGGAFGLPDARVDWSLSHVRYRRYSPFNAALRTWETERVVVEKGSVFTLQGGHIGKKGVGVVGAYRESGLGVIWFDPPFLGGQPIRHGLPLFQGWSDEGVTGASVHPSGPTTPQALHRLQARRAFLSLGRVDADVAWAESQREVIRRLYDNAARLAGVGAEHVAGPQASQWARLQTIAENASTLDAIRTEMRGVVERSGRGVGQEDRDWGVLTQLDDRFLSFGEWVVEAVEAAGSAPRVVHLARVGLRVVKKRGGRG